MSFYDDASLVLIPSAQKTSKVYSVKPTDGSGDLTFTRASTATRVNSAGLIEKVRTNLVLQSQTFDSASWTAYSGTTVTANAVTAPDGTLTAEQITGTSGSFRGIRQAISSSALPHTFSVYLRSATGSSTTARIWVDGTNTTATVTTSWQRFTVTGTTAASFEVQISTAVSSAIDVYAWGAQLETGDIATNYIPTTTAAVSVGPVNNLPRLDYTNSSCPRLLLEPQRTNLFTFSEQFNNAAWAVSSASVTANSAISPSGYMDADLINSSGSTGLVYQVKTLSGVHTISAYFKAGTSVLARLQFYDAGVSSSGIGIFNLSTLTVSASGLSSSGTITNCGSGWYRCTLTSTLSGSSINCFVGLSENAKNVYAWGAQLEAGAYATSYIPTLAASATRVADAASKTGITSLIGQTEGTLFVEIYPEEFVNGSYIGISDGTSTNRIIFGFEGGAGNLLVFGNTGLSGSGTYTRGQKIKIAIAYKSGSSALYVNGTLTSTSNGAFTASYSQFNFNSGTGIQNFFGKCAQALLFKTRLTNAELAELTAQ